MSAKRAVQASLLAVALSIGLTGCNDSEEMSQEEIRFLSHIDQSKFYQRQGELKASTQEARSAIEILPTQIEPYLLIIDNLVKAGDGASVERQVATLRSRIDDGAIDQQTDNKLSLLLAKGHYLQGEFEQTESILDRLKDPSSTQMLEAALIRGDIALAQRQFDVAKTAYNAAREQDEQDVMPLIGLSKAAFLGGQQEEAQKYVAEAETLAKDDTDLWLWKAQMAHREERWADARKGYEKALEEIGQYDVMTFRKYQTISALIEVLRAQGNAQQAFVYEEILAKSGPGTLRSNFEAAQEKYESGDLEGAASALEEILAQAPTHERAQLMLGLIRFQQGRPEDAEQLLTGLAGLNNDEADRLLAATKLQLRQPEAARELLKNIDENETNPGTLALVGMASLASGDDKTGRRYLEKALELAPDNTQLRVRYASYLASRGDRPEAIEQLQTAIKRSGDSEEAYLALARLQVAQEDYKDAETTLSQWRKALPESTRALISSGDLAAAQEDNDTAKRFYQQALQLSPKDPSVHVALGNLARRNDNPQVALGHFKDAVSQQPNSRDALRGLIQVGRSDDALYQDALNWLKELEEKQPDAIGPKLVLMEDALSQDDFATAKKIGDAIANLAATPEEAEPLLSSLYATVAQQALEASPEKALKVLKQGRERYPDNQPITLAAARVNLEIGNEQQALELIKAARQADSSSPRPFLLEADFRGGKGQFGEAAKLYSLALEKEDAALTSVKLASALQRDSQPSKAITVLETASQKHPSSSQVKLALAMAYQSANETEKAQQAYEALIALTPRNAVALNNLAWMYHEQNDERAVELAKRAYELNGRSAAIADTYGWILYSRGRVDESVPVLESAYEMAPTEQEIALHLAEAYKAAGQEDKAKVVLEKI